MNSFLGLITFVSGLSLTVTKVVDFIRNAADKNGKLVGSWVWNVAAFGGGVAFALGWQLNIGPALASLVPALASDAATLQGLAGQVLTGLMIGAGAGFWHEVLSAWSSVQTKNEAIGISAIVESNELPTTASGPYVPPVNGS
jgi:hypothetical protein